MNKISELAKLFAEYKIYPRRCYHDCSPVRAFQKKYPENHYSRDLEIFLSYQDYKPIQRGADLSWWGKDFFSGKQGYRIMVIGQDTQVKDAGSIILEAYFFPDQFDKIIDKIDIDIDKSRRGRIKKQLAEWRINLNFLYMTDASKVYKNDSWKDRDFDEEKSKKLLEAEIKFCNPNLVILLGGQPLYLLDKNQKYNIAVEAGKTILIKNKKCVVAPCFYGQGHTQRNFEERLKITTNLIRDLVL